MYVDSFHATKGEAAILASKTIHGQTSHNCVLTFWYNMNGKNMGSLEVYTAIWFGFPSNQTWYRQGDQGYQWKKARVIFDIDQDFQVLFIMFHISKEQRNIILSESGKVSWNMILLMQLNLPYW